MPTANHGNEPDLACNILRRARDTFPDAYQDIQDLAITHGRVENDMVFHDAWILSLYRAFEREYSGDGRNIAVLARPLKSSPAQDGATHIPYNRGEYGFDLAVVEMSRLPAPYPGKAGKPNEIDVVARHLWQVESEIAGDAEKVSVNLGKLTGGTAPCKLLVMMTPRQPDLGEAWRSFIMAASAQLQGHFFLAMVPSYGDRNTHDEWRKGQVPVQLFHRRPNEQHMITLQM